MVSLTPPTIDAAPDQFTYTAPPERDVTSTVTFTSTSRRGIGTLTQQVSTQEVGYRVDTRRPDGRYLFSGVVCDIIKPFVLQINGSAVNSFVGPLTVTPTGAGSLFYSFEGTFGGVVSGNATGMGTIDLDSDPATLTLGPGTWFAVLPVVGIQTIGPGGQHWANNINLDVVLIPDENLDCAPS